MWFEEAGEVVEMFRSSFPLSFLFFVPILIIISPAPAAAAQEFAVFRMQHYDLQGSNYGIYKPNCVFSYIIGIEYKIWLYDVLKN